MVGAPRTHAEPSSDPKLHGAKIADRIQDSCGHPGGFHRVKNGSSVACQQAINPGGQE